MFALDLYVCDCFPCCRVITVSSVPVNSTYRPRLDTSRLASTTTVPSITSDRKSTRLNSSHSQISYAVFCLKKKKKTHPSYNHSLQPNQTVLTPMLHADSPTVRSR